MKKTIAFHFPFDESAYAAFVKSGQKVTKIVFFESINQIVYTIPGYDCVFTAKPTGQNIEALSSKDLVLKRLPAGEYMVRHEKGGISEIYKSYNLIPEWVIGHEEYTIYKMKIVK